MTRLTRIGLVIAATVLGAAAPGGGDASTGKTADVHYVPPTGASFQIESHTRVTSGNSGISAGGQVLGESSAEIERRVTASDGLTATTANTTDDIKGGMADKLSPDGKKAFLAAVSEGATTTYRYFLPVANTTVAFMGGAVAPDGAFVGAGAGKRITTSLQCDWATLASFFPIGRIPRISMPCTETLSSEGAAPRERASMMTIAYEGDSQARTKAGDFAVRNIRITTEYLNGGASESLIRFSEKLGLPVVSDTTAKSAQAAGPEAVTHAELVRVE